MTKAIRLICLFLFASVSVAFAQKWEIGVNSGVSGYVGDFNPYKVYPTANMKYSGGIFGSYKIKPHVGIRLNANYINLAGSDATSGVQENLDRGLSFTNNIFESSLVADLEFFTFYSDRTRFRYTPYIFGGVGAMFNDAKSADGLSYIGNYAEVLNFDEIEMINLDKIKNISTKQTSQYNFILPVGVGFKVNVAGPFSLGIQLNYRFPLGNDMLDGVSGKYIPFSAEDSKINGSSLTQSAGNFAQTVPYSNLVNTHRGGQVKYDSYLTTVFTIGYSLYQFRDATWR